MATSEAGTLEASPVEPLVRVREEVTSMRAQLQAASPGMAPVLIETLAEAMQARKRVRIQEPCAKCHCSHVRWVEIPDAVAATAAAKAWLEAAEGKPATIGDVSQSGAIVRRVGLSQS